MDEEPGSSQRLRVAVLIADPHAPFQGRGDENHDYAGAEAADRAFLQAVEDAGYEPIFVPVHLANVDETIRSLDCDAVINLCDGTGIGGDGLPGVEVIDALEWRGMPYTGARADFYRLGSD